MKRIFSFLMGISLIFVNFSVRASEYTEPIPETVLRPTVSNIEKILVRDNFESGLNTNNWVGLSITEQSDGNHIGRIASGSNATYGLNRMWLGDHTIRMNVKFDYSPDAWSEVLDIKYKNDKTKGKIMLYQKSDKSISRIYLSTEGQTSNLWYSYDLPEDYAAFNNEWFFIKVEVKGQDVKIYLDSEDTPVIEAEGLTLSNAAVAFKPWASNMYIDNLVITREKNLPKETVMPAYSDENVMLANQNFDGGTPSSESGFTGGAVESGSYVLNVPVTTGEILGSRYSIEFNVKAQYTGSSGAYSDAYWKIGIGETYEFVLSSAPDGSSSINFNRKTDGDNSTVDVTAGTGPNNHAEADNIWSYIKITRDGNKFEYYFNDKVNPAYTFTDSSPLNGRTVSFDPGTLTSLCIDNILVSAPGNTKRVNVEAVSSVSDVSVSSVYGEASEAVVLLAAYSGGKLLGLYEKNILLDPSVLDGRSFAQTVVQFENVDASATASAAYVLDKSYESDCKTDFNVYADDASLNVSGAVKSPMDSSVFVVVVPEGKSIADAVMAKVLDIDKNGAFKDSIPVSGVIPEGNYTAFVYDGGTANGIQKPFQYISKANLAVFLDKLNAASESDFAELTENPDFDTYLRYLGVRIDNFKATGSINWSLVQSLASDIKGEQLYAEENTGDILNNAIITSLFVTSENAEKLINLFNTYKPDINPDNDADAIAQNNEFVRKEAFNGIYKAATSFKSINDIKAAYKEQIILSYIYKSSYMNIYDILTEYSDDLGVDLTKLPSSESERNRIMEKLNAVRCYTYEQFSELYNKSLSSPTAPSYSGGGGGGGGGGAAGRPSVPTVEAVVSGDAVKTYDKKFNDVDRQHWACDYIVSLASSGIINGYEDGNFYPEQGLTRAQLCKIAALAFEFDKTSEYSFDDVPEDEWYYTYVSTAKTAGIVNGNGSIFNPDDNITRQDTAVMLYRILQSMSIKIENSKMFSDTAQISDYAAEAVGRMAGAGILKGFDGKFEPMRNVTRAEAAKMIFETLKLINGGTVNG